MTVTRVVFMRLSVSCIIRVVGRRPRLFAIGLMLRHCSINQFGVFILKCYLLLLLPAAAAAAAATAAAVADTATATNY
jgi:hypothetical protein